MLETYIKLWDYFWHSALMHFGRNPVEKQEGDDSVKTVVGGFYSMVLRIAYLYTVYYYANKMFIASDNQLSTVDTNAFWQLLPNE